MSTRTAADRPDEEELVAEAGCCPTVSCSELTRPIEVGDMEWVTRRFLWHAAEMLT